MHIESNESSSVSVIGKSSSCAFDYSRFNLYLKIQNNRERLKRIEHRIQGKLSPWLSLEFYTDVILQKELTLIYGQLDTSSRSYSRVFATYKEDRLEQIEEWIQEEKQIIRNRYLSGQKLIDQTYRTPPEAVPALSDHFSVEELEIYQRLHNDTTSILPFLLPWCNRVPTNPQSTQLQHNKSPRTPSSPPDLQRVGCIAGGKDQTFCRRLPTKNVTEERGSSSVASEVHEGKNSELPVLSLKEFGLITTRQFLFGNILHKLECIFFALSPRVDQLPLHTAMKHFLDLFGLEITLHRVKGWGFQSIQQFLSTIIKTSPSTQIGMLSSSDLFLSGDSLHIVTKEHEQKTLHAKGIKTSQTRNQMMPRKELIPVQPLAKQMFSKVGAGCTGTGIPKDCMQFGDRMETVSEWMDSTESNRRRQDFLCVLLNYMTPMDFYVALRQNWDQLQKFQKELTSAYEVLDITSAKEISINANFEFRHGLYLVVVRNSGENTEYFRCQYVEKRYDGSHRVFLLDHGEFINVQLSQLRFLRKYIAHELKGQAIWCGLDSILPQTNWSQRVIDTAYDMISRKPFPAKFNCKINFQGRDQWFLKSKGIRDRKHQDVGEVVKGMFTSEVQLRQEASHF